MADISKTERKGIRVTAPATRVTLGALVFLFAAMVYWIFFGTISDKDHMSGVVFPDTGTYEVSVPYDGQVKDIFVTNGQTVRQGEPLASVSIAGAYSVLSSPCGGTVLNFKPVNDVFNAYEGIVNILPDTESGIVRRVVALTDFRTQRELRVGQDAQITPSNETRERVGYVNGKVTSVSQYPVTRQEMLTKLNNSSIVDEIFPESGSVFEVTITMDMDENDPSQLDWSFPLKEEVETGVGTFCDITVIIRARSVFQYLMENVRETGNKIRLIAK